MYPFYLELELVKPVSDYFIEHGYTIKYEIRIGFCRADLVAFKKDKVVAVELKLSDWKKAIVQTKNYQLGADYVYLAVPLMKSYNIIRKSEHILIKNGIGLLSVNEKNCEVTKIIKAKKSKKKIASIKVEEISRIRKNRTKFF